MVSKWFRDFERWASSSWSSYMRGTCVVDTKSSVCEQGTAISESESEVFLGGFSDYRQRKVRNLKCAKLN